MAAHSHTLNRPTRSLVSHIKLLAGVEPLTAREFIDGSCDAARKRLKLRPAWVKTSRKTTREGRHIIVNVTDRVTGEKRKVRARRRKPIRVYHYTTDQVVKILKEAKPRKPEYKEIKETVLANLEALAAAEKEEMKRPMRMLPRHTKWSKRRHRR